ncbi:MAG: hypothetical protein ACK559_02585, partial [bacterium]
ADDAFAHHDDLALPVAVKVGHGDVAVGLTVVPDGRAVRAVHRVAGDDLLHAVGVEIHGEAGGAHVEGAPHAGAARAPQRARVGEDRPPHDDLGLAIPVHVGDRR